MEYRINYLVSFFCPTCPINVLPYFTVLFTSEGLRPEDDDVFGPVTTPFRFPVYRKVTVTNSSGTHQIDHRRRRKRKLTKTYVLTRDLCLDGDAPFGSVSTGEGSNPSDESSSTTRCSLLLEDDHSIKGLEIST